MRIYISGKITGTTDYKEKFEKAAEQIAAKGHIPINPVDIDKVVKDELTWSECMQIAVTQNQPCGSDVAGLARQ